MTATHPESERIRALQESMADSLERIEAELDRMSDCMFDRDYFDALGEQLGRLHARLRQHHAIESYHAGGDSIAQRSPEYADQIARLHAEHSTILGMLDRLIRQVESVVDHALEDKEVFAMRGRELIAVVRRHEVEEDRLFYLSLWRDTGGES